MIAPWIKIEVTTPDKPEIVAMAETLKKDPDLIVGKLIRLWCWTDQNSVAGETVSITRKWIDRHVGLRGFAAAMESVGWLGGQDLALEFPNFSRHNGKSAKRRAMEKRKKDRQRHGTKVPESPPLTRDKCPAANGINVPPLSGPKGGLEEEEEYRERESAGAHASAAQQIVDTYPRREGYVEALKVVEHDLSQGQDPAVMLAATRAAAAVIRRAPSGHLNRFTPKASTFFRERRWMDDPETLIRAGNAATGQAQMSLDEAKAALGGRAAYLDPDS